MRKVVFTICAKNYIGLAQVLEKSIIEHNEDVDFYIFCADEFQSTDKIESLPNNVLIAKEVLNFTQEKWNELSFKYEITEFCTCIKASCFKYIFEKFQPDACIYFDPDILVFSSLEYVFEKLEQHSIILTPHITSMEDVYTGKLKEQNLLYSGMYNLGFLALRNDNNSHKMLNWWEIRLDDRCFQNVMENYFTDQKWMDFLPCFFPTGLFISFNLGLNLAPWNFYEREIVCVDNSYYITNRINKDDKTLYPLVFVHFSGFKYDLLLNDEISGGNIQNLKIENDLICIFKVYSAYLRTSDFSKYISLGYTYNYFSNKAKISMVHRKFFRRLIEDKKTTNNPFDANEDFFLSLKRHGLVKKRMAENDKSYIHNVDNAERKTILINKLFISFFRIIGAEKYFLIVRLMRAYSKYENHIYLIDRSYLKKFKIWT